MLHETMIPLVNGLWLIGSRHGQAALRQLTGAHELLVHEARAGGIPPAAIVTSLLAATVLRIGGIADVGVEHVRRLTIGDRERLLLGLHTATFGPRLDLVARCPAECCGEFVEIELPAAVMDLLADASPAPEHHLTVETASGLLRVRFRLPSGEDQEMAVARATDLGSAADAMLVDCLEAVTNSAGRPVAAETVLEAIRAPLAQAIRTLDPGADTEVAVACPACGTSFQALLDGFALLAGALTPADALFAEVDVLARAYYWREPDILALPVPRRRRYLALVAAGNAA
jgi:hypothetical protein